MMDSLPTVATSFETNRDAEEGEDKVDASNKLDQFQSEVYVTRATEQDLHGRRNAHKGRPDIPKIIQEINAIAKDRGSARVAVVTCGPRGLVEDVKAHCRKAGVDFHDEIFDF